MYIDHSFTKFYEKEEKDLMQKTVKLGILGKSAIVALAVILLLSILSPLYQIPNVSAASAFTSATTVYVNADNYSDFAKSGITLEARFYNASGTYLGNSSVTKQSDGLYYFTVAANTAKIEIVRLDNSVLSVSGSPASGYNRIYFNNTSNWSTVKAYAWYMNGSTAVEGLGAWPGKAMTRIGTSSYYYIDVKNTFTNIIFNNGSTQTDNLTINTAAGNLYTFSNNLWSTYGVVSTISATASSRASNSANTLYVTGESSCKWSKYATPISSNLTTVYVKASSWSSAYVSYDPNDPLSVVTKCSNTTTSGSSSSSYTGYFKVQIPTGSNFIFKPNAGSDNAGSTSTLSVPSGLSKPCYNVITKRWQELSQSADSVSYSVTQDNYSSYSNIIGVKATYYDYLSDAECNGTWLNPIQAGTGFNGSQDNWYPFYIFNQKLSALAKSNSSWSKPLYFGNFCNTSGAYDTSDHASGGWSNVTNSTNAYKFDYYANNSNGLYDSYTSYQGLMRPSLINDKLMVTDSLQAPYFNNEWLISENIGRVVKATFPFTVEDKGTYKYYEFNSKDAEDNVYFTWANSSSESYPTRVNYGGGSNYGIDDGLKYFMNGGVSGKGIFPFNNVSGTKGTKNSNENKNYGFGIRMDIDFRVPENGLVPNSSTPITFDFTGDDDLWVYITDKDTGASQLVLDMGGDHKESHGQINFNTKTATVDKVHIGTGTQTFTGYLYLNKDNAGWGTPYAYFFNNSGTTVGNSWPGMAMSKYDSSNNYRIKIPDGATRVVFNNGNGDGTNQTVNVTDLSWGAYYLEGLSGGNWQVKNWAEKPSDAGSYTVTCGTASSKTTSFTFDNTDSQKTYTMSVFYMERGLLESNMKIGFTITPLTNDLTVDKQINTADINTGLVDAVKENEKFDYTVYDDGALATYKSYSATHASSGTTSSTGQFDLMHNTRARFDGQFETGSQMKIIESAISESGLEYTTAWKLSDNNTGEQLSTGNTTTSDFKLINSKLNEDEKTSLYLEYVNTPVVAPITVSKNVVDKNGDDISSSSNAVFNYTLSFDLNNSNSYNAYDLSYELYESGSTQPVGTYTATDGKFSIKAGQEAVFNGIPVGAKYQLTEEVKEGYTMYMVNGSTSSFSNNIFTSSVGEGDNTAAVTNMYKPVGAFLKANKTLDGQSYSGSEFTFKAEGMASQNVDGISTLDTTSVSVTVSSVSNGRITFENTSVYKPFTYSQTGIYCYKIYEVKDSQNTDYIYDETVYYAKVVVTADSSGNLLVADPVYYSDSTFSTVVSASDVKFENESANCTVRVAKCDKTTFSIIPEGEFKLVPAKKVNNEWVEDTSKTAYGPVAVSEIDYYAEFTDIPQGDYLVIETKAPSGYELSTEKIYVNVKRTSQNNGIITVEFYDNPKTELPVTGGIGIAPYICAGAVSIALSLLFFTFRKNKSEYAPKRYK